MKRFMILVTALAVCLGNAAIGGWVGSTFPAHVWLAVSLTTLWSLGSGFAMGNTCYIAWKWDAEDRAYRGGEQDYFLESLGDFGNGR